MAEELGNKPVEDNAQAQEFTKEDITQNKVMAIFAYLGPLVFIPLFAAKQSKYAHFHAVQGFTLFIIEAIAFLLCPILVVFNVFGIIYAAKGEAKELPVIGKIKIIK